MDTDLATALASVWADVSTDGKGGEVTDGEAEAARNWSSRLAPTTDAGDDLDGVSADFEGAWNGNEDGSDESCVMFGNERVESLKRRPL